MIRQKTGIALESFRLGIKDSIKTASTLGFKGIQIDATQRDITPGESIPNRSARFESYYKYK